MQSPYEVAQELVGMGEAPDRASLQDFLSNGGQNLDPVTTAWCAAFVNASLGKAGMEGTGKLNARSFLDWGQEVDEPQKGDVAVFSRGDPNGGQGHVGFFDGYNDDGTIRVLGGNQGDAVSIANYSPNALLGFRRGEPQVGYEEMGNVLRGPDFNPNARIAELMAQQSEPANALRSPQNGMTQVDPMGSYLSGQQFASQWRRP
jgi:uncharacterized protein (TIGR02594 family)